VRQDWNTLLPPPAGDDRFLPQNPATTHSGGKVGTLERPNAADLADAHRQDGRKNLEKGASRTELRQAAATNRQDLPPNGQSCHLCRLFKFI
jgi:hypothetical protein